MRRESRARPRRIRLNSASDVGVTVYYNTAEDRIEVDEIRISGGRIELQGHTLNTGYGEVRAFGGYGQITVNNQTPYDIAVNRLDASLRGEGVVVFSDKARGSASNPVATVFQKGPAGVTVTEDDGSGGVAKPFTGNYATASGWRYGWSTGQETATRTKTTYGTSSGWLSIDALSADPDNITSGPFTENISVPRLMGDGPYYFRQTFNSSRYDYQLETVPLSSRDFVEAEWTTGNWFTGKSHFQRRVVETTQQEIHTHSVEADRPIKVTFTGADEASISVNSTGGGRVLIGDDVLNPNGVTSITTNASIVQLDADSIVTGRRVVLTAATGVGGADPIRTDVNDADPFAGVKVSTTTGAINLREVSGDLPVETITTSAADPVTLWSRQSLRAAQQNASTFHSGLVQGGKLNLTASLGGIGASDRLLAIDSGSVVKDTLLANAAGSIYLAEQTGDLWLDQVVSNTGDVEIQVLAGGLFDGSTPVRFDSRTVEQQEELWNDQQLTAEAGREQHIQAELDAFAASREQEYRDYWNFRNLQSDPAVYDSNFVVLLNADEENFYRNEQGLDNAQIDALVQQRTDAYHALHSDFGSFGNSFDPNFDYAPTAAEETEIRDGIRIWTAEELANAVPSEIFDAASSVQVADVEPANVSGVNVTLSASGGVGIAVGQVAVDLTEQPLDIGAAEQLALQQAQRRDVTYIAGSTLVDDPQDPQFELTAMLVDTREDVDIQATGVINVTSGAQAFLGSALDVQLESVNAAEEVRIDSDQNIINVAGAGATTIVAGDLFLNADNTSVGTTDSPIRIDLHAGGRLSAAAAEDIFIDEVASDLIVLDITAGQTATINNVGNLTTFQGLGIVTVGDTLTVTADRIRTDVGNVIEATNPGSLIDFDATTRIEIAGHVTGSSTIDMDAGDTISIQEGGVVSAAGDNGQVLLDAPNEVAVESGGAVLAGVEFDTSVPPQPVVTHATADAILTSGHELRVAGTVAAADELVLNAGTAEADNSAFFQGFGAGHILENETSYSLLISGSVYALADNSELVLAAVDPIVIRGNISVLGAGSDILVRSDDWVFIEGELHAQERIRVYGGFDATLASTGGNVQGTSVYVDPTSQVTTAEPASTIEYNAALDAEVGGVTIAGGKLDGSVVWTGPDSSVTVAPGEQARIFGSVAASKTVTITGAAGADDAGLGVVIEPIGGVFSGGLTSDSSGGHVDIQTPDNIEIIGHVVSGATISLDFNEDNVLLDRTFNWSAKPSDVLIEAGGLAFIGGNTSNVAGDPIETGGFVFAAAAVEINGVSDGQGTGVRVHPVSEIVTHNADSSIEINATEDADIQGLLLAGGDIQQQRDPLGLLLGRTVVGFAGNSSITVNSGHQVRVGGQVSAGGLVELAGGMDPVEAGQELSGEGVVLFGSALVETRSDNSEVLIHAPAPIDLLPQAHAQQVQADAWFPTADGILPAATDVTLDVALDKTGFQITASVALPQAVTSDNLAIDDLVADLQAALEGANWTVAASTDGNHPVGSAYEDFAHDNAGLPDMQVKLLDGKLLLASPFEFLLDDTSANADVLGFTQLAGGPAESTIPYMIDARGAGSQVTIGSPLGPNDKIYVGGNVRAGAAINLHSGVSADGLDFELDFGGRLETVDGPLELSTGEFADLRGTLIAGGDQSDIILSAVGTIVIRTELQAGRHIEVTTTGAGLEHQEVATRMQRGTTDPSPPYLPLVNETTGFKLGSDERVSVFLQTATLASSGDPSVVETHIRIHGIDSVVAHGSIGGDAGRPHTADLASTSGNLFVTSTAGRVESETAILLQGNVVDFAGVATTQTPSAAANDFEIQIDAADTANVTGSFSAAGSIQIEAGQHVAVSGTDIAVTAPDGRVSIVSGDTITLGAVGTASNHPTLPDGQMFNVGGLLSATTEVAIAAAGKVEVLAGFDISTPDEDSTITVTAGELELVGSLYAGAQLDGETITWAGNAADVAIQTTGPIAIGGDGYDETGALVSLGGLIAATGNLAITTTGAAGNIEIPAGAELRSDANGGGVLANPPQPSSIQIDSAADVDIDGLVRSVDTDSDIAITAAGLVSVGNLLDAAGTLTVNGGANASGDGVLLTSAGTLNAGVGQRIDVSAAGDIDLFGTVGEPRQLPGNMVDVDINEVTISSTTGRVTTHDLVNARDRIAISGVNVDILGDSLIKARHSGSTIYVEASDRVFVEKSDSTIDRAKVDAASLVHLHAEELEVAGILNTAETASLILLNARNDITVLGRLSSAGDIEINAGVPANLTEAQSAAGGFTLAQLDGGNLFINDEGLLDASGEATLQAADDVRIKSHTVLAAETRLVPVPRIVSEPHVVQVVTGYRQVPDGTITVPQTEWVTTTVTEQTGVEEIVVGQEFVSGDVTLTQDGYWNGNTATLREWFVENVDYCNFGLAADDECPASGGATTIETQTLFSEDFEGLNLGNSSRGSDGDNQTDFTSVPPAGWTTNDRNTPSSVPVEYRGWSFLDKQFWINERGYASKRSQFAPADGAHNTIAVADADGALRSVSPRVFNSVLTTSSTSLADVQPSSLVLEFDSSWKPLGGQTGQLRVVFDGSNSQTLFSWNSSNKGENLNEHLTIPLNNPAGATSMHLEFDMPQAGWDWWWAIDNVEVTGAVAVNTSTAAAPVIDWSGVGVPGDAQTDFNELTDAQRDRVLETLGFQPLYDFEFANGQLNRNVEGVTSTEAFVPDWIGTPDVIASVDLDGWRDRFIRLPEGAVPLIVDQAQRVTAQGASVTSNEAVGFSYDTAVVDYTQDRSSTTDDTPTSRTITTDPNLLAVEQTFTDTLIDNDDSPARWTVAYDRDGARFFDISDGRSGANQVNHDRLPDWNDDLLESQQTDVLGNFANAPPGFFATTAANTAVFADDFDHPDGTALASADPDVGLDWEHVSGPTLTVNGGVIDTNGGNRNVRAHFADSLGPGETLVLNFETVESAGDLHANGWAGMFLSAGATEGFAISDPFDRSGWHVIDRIPSNTFHDAQTIGETQTGRFLYDYDSGAFALWLGGEQVVAGTSTAGQALDRLVIANSGADIAFTSLSVEFAGLTNQQLTATHPNQPAGNDPLLGAYHPRAYEYVSGAVDFAQALEDAQDRNANTTTFLARPQSPTQNASVAAVIPGVQSATDTTNDGTGTITSESQNSGSGEGNDKAFDNSSGSKWLAFGNDDWIQYQYANGDKYVVDSYTITSANDAPDRDPKNWTLQGSNDGVNFTTLDTRTNEDFPSRFQKRTFSFTNTTGYNIYRLDISAVAFPSGTLQLAEIELIGVPEASGADDAWIAATKVDAGETSIVFADDFSHPNGTSLAAADPEFGLDWQAIGGRSIPTIQNGVVEFSSDSPLDTIRASFDPLGPGETAIFQFEAVAAAASAADTGSLFMVLEDSNFGGDPGLYVTKTWFSGDPDGKWRIFDPASGQNSAILAEGDDQFGQLIYEYDTGNYEMWFGGELTVSGTTDSQKDIRAIFVQNGTGVPLALDSFQVTFTEQEWAWAETPEQLDTPENLDRLRYFNWAEGQPGEDSTVEEELEGGPITEWKLLLGGASTSGLNTDTPVVGDGSADNAEGSSFAGQFAEAITLEVGDSLTVSGTVNLTGGFANPNGQFRFGVFNDGGQFAANSASNWAAGWLHDITGGYSIQGDLYQARTDGAFASTGGNSVDLNATKSSTPTNSFAGNSTAPYTWSMTVTRDSAATVDLTSVFNGGDGGLLERYEEADVTTSNFTYTATGWLFGGVSGLDQATFSNVDVTVSRAAGDVLDGLVARYTLDDGTGSLSAIDVAGGHHATSSNMDPANDWISSDLASVPSGTSSALDFDGVDDELVATGFKGVTGTGARTIALWMKAGSQTNANATLVSWGDDGGGERYDFRLINGFPRVEVAGGGITATAGVLDGQWHHVAAVLPNDGSPNTNEITIYIDGVADSATGSNRAINTPSVNDVRIGNSFLTAFGERDYIGQLDEVRIYDRDLTAEEIAILADGVAGGGGGEITWSHKIADGTAAIDVTTGDHLGEGMAEIGDLNGDGTIDLAVGAARDDVSSGSDRGSVYVLLMNADGTPASSVHVTHNTNGGPSLASKDTFGWSAAGIGDLDGDGVPDLAVGAPEVTSNASTGQTGAVYMLLMNSNGTVKSHVRVGDNANGGPNIGQSDRFSEGIAGIGDLDGDGVPDVAVGAPRNDAGGNDRGAVHVLFMNSNGTVKSSTKIAHNTAGGPSLQDGDWFGNTVESLGDLDGDGKPELAVGTWFDDTGGNSRGAVYVLELNSDGTVSSTSKIAHETNGGPTLADDDAFGRAIVSLGDIDGDQVPDMAVSAWRDDTGGSNRGAVYVLLMNADGSVKESTKIASGSPTGLALANNDLFGTSLAYLGPLDGGSVIGIAVGAQDDDTGGANAGAVHVVKVPVTAATPGEPAVRVRGSDGKWISEDSNSTSGFVVQHEPWFNGADITEDWHDFEYDWMSLATPIEDKRLTTSFEWTGQPTEIINQRAQFETFEIEVPIVRDVVVQKWKNEPIFEERTVFTTGRVVEDDPTPRNFGIVEFDSVNALGGVTINAGGDFEFSGRIASEGAAGSITIHADGDATIQGERPDGAAPDVLEATSSLKAAERIDLSTGQGITVARSGLLTVDDGDTVGVSDITFTAGTGIFVEGELTAYDQVIFNANDDIELRGNITAGHDLVANAGLDGTGSVLGDIYSELTTTLGSSITIVAGADDGDISFLDSDLSTGGDMTLTAPAGLIEHGGGTITANTLSASARDGISMQVNVANFSAVAGQDVDLIYNNPDTVIDALNTDNGDISVQAFGNLTFNQIQAANGGDVTLDVIGDLIPAGDPGQPDIIADNFDLTIQGGVNLELQVNSLAVAATDAGSVVISNDSDLTVTDASTADGAIAITTGGNLIAESIESLTNRDTNDITLTSTAGGIELGFLRAGDYAATQAESDAIRTLTDGGVLPSLTALGDVVLSAAGSIREVVDEDTAVDLIADELTLTATGDIVGIELAANTLLEARSTTGAIELTEADGFDEVRPGFTVLSAVTESDAPVSISGGEVLIGKEAVAGGITPGVVQVGGATSELSLESTSGNLYIYPGSTVAVQQAIALLATGDVTTEQLPPVDRIEIRAGRAITVAGLDRLDLTADTIILESGVSLIASGNLHANDLVRVDQLARQRCRHRRDRRPERRRHPGAAYYHDAVRWHADRLRRRSGFRLGRAPRRRRHSLSGRSGRRTFLPVATARQRPLRVHGTERSEWTSRELPERHTRFQRNALPGGRNDSDRPGGRQRSRAGLHRSHRPRSHRRPDSSDPGSSHR